MRARKRRSCSCTYAVAIDGTATDADVKALARYLSGLSLAGCDVLVFDSAAPAVVASRRCVLRWVARHLAVPGQYLRPDGTIDLTHAAADFASTDKVIVASMITHYTAREVGQMCELLERHELVEPQEYVGPLPWWAGIEAAGVLLHRGAHQRQELRTTFGFRRSAYRPARGAGRDGITGDDLAFFGAEVHEASNVFVRREPRPVAASMLSASGAVEQWSPMRSVFFFAVVPLLIALVFAGGVRIAGGYAGVLAFASVLLAVRGRIGASRFFPLRACLFAPLWIVERSIAAHWSLIARLRGASPDRAAASSARPRERKASGE